MYIVKKAVKQAAVQGVEPHALHSKQTWNSQDVAGPMERARDIFEGACRKSRQCKTASEPVVTPGTPGSEIFMGESSVGLWNPQRGDLNQEDLSSETSSVPHPGRTLCTSRAHGMQRQLKRGPGSCTVNPQAKSPQNQESLTLDFWETPSGPGNSSPYQESA